MNSRLSCGRNRPLVGPVAARCVALCRRCDREAAPAATRFVDARKKRIRDACELPTVAPRRHLVDMPDRSSMSHVP